MTRLLLTILTLFTVVLGGCSTAEPAKETKTLTEPITVSAAISMKDALEEIKAAYCKEKNISPDLIRFNYGGSGTLRQQIEQNAPVDIFISASQNHMDKLDKAGKIKTSQPYVKNILVAIAPKDNTTITGMTDITTPTVSRIAIGEPKTVPAGAYGMEVLKNSNTLDTVQDKIVYAKDVRAVLTYIAQHSADFGFVYKTDALIEPQVRIVEEIPDRLHTPIIYPMGLLKNAKAGAEDFYAYLNSDGAQKILSSYGFAPAGK